MAIKIGGNTVVDDNGVVYLSDSSTIASKTFTTSTTNQVAIDTFAVTTFRTVKYLTQITSGSSYHSIELMAIHNGTVVQLVQYGELTTNGSLGTFDATISAGTFSLLFTPVNAVTTVKFTRTLLVG